jgi:hypothetical protein
MSDFTAQDFMETLGQYLGVSQEDLSEGNLLDSLAPVPDEEKIKSDLRSQYKDVLGSLQEQTKGYTAGVREAMSSQQRQELVESARKTGAGQRMLAGRAKGAALVQARSNQAGAQAGVVQNVAEQEKELKESAKSQLSDLETSIAQSAQAKADSDRERRVKVGMSLFQLAELARQKTEQGQ